MFQSEEPQPVRDSLMFRRFLKFCRTHKINYEHNGTNSVCMGSGICHFVNGQIQVTFPRIRAHYNVHVWFNVYYDDVWNSYLNLSRKHNKLMGSFPMSVTRYLPELFD